MKKKQRGDMSHIHPAVVEFIDKERGCGEARKLFGCSVYKAHQKKVFTPFAVVGTLEHEAWEYSLLVLCHSCCMNCKLECERRVTDLVLSNMNRSHL